MNDLRRTEQARPEPGHPDQEGPVTAAQSKTRRRTPQGDAELMAKEQVLRFKPARRLEEVDDEHGERMQKREHRPRSCDDSTRRCDSQAGWDFRKGQVIRLFEEDPILKTRFGGADRFIRMWEYYLAGFEASFRSYGLAVFQIQLIKNIDAVLLTRGYMYENKDERTSNWKIIAAAE